MNEKVALVILVVAILSSSVTMRLGIPATLELRVHNLRSLKDYATIQEAINAPETLNGDTLRLDSGQFRESVELNKSLTITGMGDSTVIDGQGSAFAISVSNQVDVSMTYLAVMNARTGLRFTNCRGINIGRVAVRQCTLCGIDLNNCQNSTLSKSEVTGYLGLVSVICGINVTDCSDLNVEDNTVSNLNGTGISLSGSRISLRQNEMKNNRFNLDVRAPFLYDIDASNTVDGKPVCYLINKSDQLIVGPSAGGPDIGFVALVNCLNVTVRGLILTRNGVGILLVNTTKSQIASNFCQDNIEGIRLVKSSQNMIYENTINSSSLTGIRIESTESLGNRIYHNQVFNNAVNAYTVDGNDWDDGYPNGGNYWGGYVDVDSYRGADQKEPGGDGIWDHPYVINPATRDRYPFVHAIKITSYFSIAWNETNYTIAVFTDSLIKNPVFNNSSKQIIVESIGGTCFNITIPKALLDGTYALSIDDAPTAAILTWSEDRISACLNYSLTGLHTIKLTGEYVAKPPISVFPDLNGDGRVDIVDVTMVALHFGEPYEQP